MYERLPPELIRFATGLVGRDDAPDVMATAFVKAMSSPIVALDLGMRAVDQQWVITAYLVALAGLMPVAGRLADHLGRRSLYLGGLALFGVGTVISRSPRPRGR